jgi:hypothetical protein
MHKFLSLFIIFLTFRAYALSDSIEVTVDNLSCLGFSVSSLEDNHLIIVFPPDFKGYKLTNTLLSYTFLGEKIFITQNRFDSSSKKHEVEVSFLKGVENGTDASLIGYYASYGDSKIYRFSSLAKLVNTEPKACKKL